MHMHIYIYVLLLLLLLVIMITTTVIVSIPDVALGDALEAHLDDAAFRRIIISI